MTWAPGEIYKRHFTFEESRPVCGRKVGMFTLRERRLIDTDCGACKNILNRKLKIRINSNLMERENKKGARWKMFGAFPILVFGDRVIRVGHSWKDAAAARAEGKQILKEFLNPDVPGSGK